MDKGWNFLYICHMMKEVSHMTYITCFYLAFTVQLAQSCTVCTANAQSNMTNSDEEESYYFLSCNISLTLAPQLYRNVSRTFYLRLCIVGKLDSGNVYKKG